MSRLSLSSAVHNHLPPCTARMRTGAIVNTIRHIQLHCLYSICFFIADVCFIVTDDVIAKQCNGVCGVLDGKSCMCLCVHAFDLT